MISQRTFIVALLLICAIEMIQAGVIDDIAEAVHLDDIKNVTKNAAEKTGEAAANAYDNAKSSVSRIVDDSANPGQSSAAKF